MRVYPERVLLQGMESEIWKLVSYSATPQQWKEWLRVPLKHAAARGNLNLVNSLLEAGADGSAGWKGAQPDVNVLSVSSKRSALYTATVCGHEDAARRLITAGADVNFDDPVHCSHVLYEAILGGHTQLLTLSCESGHLSVVNTLLTAGANVTIRSIGGYSALDKAVFNGHIDVIGTLLRHGADVNPCGNDGWTPLHLAAQNDRAAAIDALIQAGANTEAGLGDRLTPLFSATDRGNISAMRALPRRGASLTAQDTDGGTPLHWACYWQVRGVEATVDLLLRWGADETALDNDSKTPADLLDEDDNENDRTTCSEAEIEQVRLLMARAPANRAWRRRCWLVMLRSYAKTARATTEATGDADEGSKDAGDRNGGKCNGARRENGESAGGWLRSRMNGAGEVGVDIGAAGLASIVNSVVGLEPEEVFRSIVGFL
ncbi:unnamed protein product [Ectocarpus sp. CCAP 1310/34]|nr:unnamed protein product [Ectocarpus sp. CCAP 1310/34]